MLNTLLFIFVLHQVVYHNLYVIHVRMQTCLYVYVYVRIDACIYV